MLNRFDFKKDRRLINCLNDELFCLSIKCFEENSLDLEIATLIYEELKYRKSSSSNKLLSDLLLGFSIVNHQPIQWLNHAKSIIRSIKNVDHNLKYTISIYAILRDGYSNKNQRYGVYVGQTSKSVEERFLEHKSGINSGRGLPIHGIQILRSLWPFEKVKGSKKLFYETALNLSLKKIVPKVSGDINMDLMSTN
mgnify:CR=1 FL=1